MQLGDNSFMFGFKTPQLTVEFFISQQLAIKYIPTLELYYMAGTFLVKNQGCYFINCAITHFANEDVR